MNKRKNSGPLPSLHQHSDVQMLQREQAKMWVTVTSTLLARADLQAEQPNRAIAKNQNSINKNSKCCSGFIF